MTHAEAYAELLKVNAKVDAIERDPRFYHRAPDYSALLDRWMELTNIIDPGGKINFLGDITVFEPRLAAPAKQKATSANQMELFR